MIFDHDGQKGAVYGKTFNSSWACLRSRLVLESLLNIWRYLETLKVPRYLTIFAFWSFLRHVQKWKTERGIYGNYGRVNDQHNAQFGGSIQQSGGLRP